MNIDRAAFLAWLQSLEPNDVVGLRYVSHACPLATFMGRSGDEHPLAGRVVCGCGETATPTPQWARQFIDWVDGRGLYEDEVTAADALRFFDDPEPMS